MDNNLGLEELGVVDRLIRPIRRNGLIGHSRHNRLIGLIRIWTER